MIMALARLFSRWPRITDMPAMSSSVYPWIRAILNCFLQVRQCRRLFAAVHQAQSEYRMGFGARVITGLRVGVHCQANFRVADGFFAVSVIPVRNGSVDPVKGWKQLVI